ncbi:TPA: hypothetical protein SUY24_001077 [Streptococcus equi subsp. equi]|uniref:hypothetical protein n=1 Tax=Streptococcus equi TaxID=1336 RepID=UPI000658D61D|nr:hypothetical protein [Streptococcus equi]ASB95809.1 phage membrane protein [Streptococcus equi subsp. equi]MBT1197801.1 hypothetical protein [Streptococcus equi subsp. equi]MBT1197814.1 hypothetical protein [Streptococcus equi subsp. equi]MBT1198169.1 hypothetical protein [Streptococcus equi subsp. equi]MBT1201717.1 hypothetical protein [Streptococcus equi subsp. equi]
MTKNDFLTGFVLILLAACIFAAGFVIGSDCSSEHYEQQMTGLRMQLVNTQQQLKRASEDRARRTKRIADLTGNGG